jgi:hypothetical protein
MLHMPDIIPFANPFGASVLHCGHPGCHVSFLPDNVPDDWTPQKIVKVRQARSKHLIEVYGIATRFERNETGLPEPTTVPQPPSSMHCTLHISFARAWAELTIERRRVIADGWRESGTETAAIQEHIDVVRKKICDCGRGNVFSDKLEEDIKGLFPSFFDVLREALVLDGKDGNDVVMYEHKFEENQMAKKVAYELKAAKML